MKKIAILLTIFLLLSVPLFCTSVESFSSVNSFLGKEKNIFPPYSIVWQNINKRYQGFQERILNRYLNINDDLGGFIFSPVDIELKDDAFHGADTFHFAEWWYFDARFENGYSVQMSVSYLNLLNQAIIFQRLDMYKNGDLLSHNKKMYHKKDFYSSRDIPLIKLEGKEVINGYIDEKNGDWIYDISFQIDNVSADLQFVGCTKGWKGRTPFGGWGVILPRAEVNGKININDQDINVSGIGYHDHNWEVTLHVAINFGWYWGKINTNNFTIIWSTIMRTCFLGQPLLVINEKNGDYINIEPENIQFNVKELSIKNGKIVPSSFSLDAHNDYVSFQVDMKSLEIHHIRFFGVVNYWRYHIRCTGTITINNQTEIIDDIEIAEFFRIR